MGNRKIKNILDLEMDKMLFKTPIKPAEILNPFLFRSSSFLNLALLDSFNRIPAKPLGSQ
jgi:hypothetical protein